MRLPILGTLILAASLLAVSEAQTFGSGLFPNFPFVACQRSQSAYKVASTVTSGGSNTYCFTLRVSVPDNCASYCCQDADLRKFELNVYRKCDISGIKLRATLDGAPAKTVPTIVEALDGKNDSTILRLPALGLNQSTADGVELCITLGPNSNGEGCLTLEELCVPPEGFPAGTCTTALFDTQNDCCPLSRVTVPPPSPPPSPPPPAGCSMCAYFTVVQTVPVAVPFTFSQADCDSFAATVSSGMDGLSIGAVVRPFELQLCSGSVVKVCGGLDYSGPADLLSATLENLASFWLEQALGGGTCPAYLLGQTISVNIGGDGDPINPPPSCGVSVTKAAACSLPTAADGPACDCNSRQRATPFAMVPVYTEKKGRFANTNMYCFDFLTIAPEFPNGPCGSTTTLAKVEFWVDDAYRRNLTSVGVQPSDATRMTWLAPSFATSGDLTLKVSNLNWSLSQARGARICMDLDKSVPMADFCLGKVPGHCWAALFDTSLKCCPLYIAST
ncbi:extracellular matrix glycoprotein pherophorin-V11 [Volvox carteri f. nagariensis]|uniref:Extracellular matrix glycoprotein pherophorin-V11 n=1 Tax=Volvox carteri f. nagariensis TaxID=3068 RepID=D8TTQ0_VOLCA|nr:extracellular matrix glycoprotein pherophorin-V11 [Volvox carteri f. nagariensis]EFJ49347.1 extracellular matrix glycoprotein pherophorin-V11 [Volvox carteri f. nagariensis]|eukprot:XP_002949795.1 extracellular matrix glycoprotein pherophorin-V11 [Volvox carteri f. nagariensis]